MELLRHEWISKTLAWVKEVRHKSTYFIFHLHETLEKTNLIYSVKNQISDCLGPEWKCRIVWEGIQGNSFEWYKCLLSWLWPSTWIYKFIKTHQNVYLKWVYFIVFNYTSIKFMFFKVTKTKKAPLETQIKLYFNYTLHFKSNKIWIHFQSCQRKKGCHICENYTRKKYYRREMSRENNDN